MFWRVWGFFLARLQRKADADVCCWKQDRNIIKIVVYCLHFDQPINHLVVAVSIPDIIVYYFITDCCCVQQCLQVCPGAELLINCTPSLIYRL